MKNAHILLYTALFTSLFSSSLHLNLTFSSKLNIQVNRYKIAINLRIHVFETKWCVITGAPSSGKTTLVDALAKLGYLIEPEVARSYIESMLACRFSLDEIHGDLLSLQRKILALKLKREHLLDHNQPIIFDRGIPDSIAYFNFYNLNPKPALQAAQHHRYQTVFFCEPLPFVPDTVRIENAETAKSLSELIYDAYCQLGYELIRLPAVSVEQRMAIILDHL